MSYKTRKQCTTKEANHASKLGLAWFFAGAAVATVACALLVPDEPGDSTAVGDKVSDGSIHAITLIPKTPWFDDGERPATTLYVGSSDAPLRLTWDQAVAYCADLQAHNHEDWRLPSPYELVAIHKNRNVIGGFKEDWYWSSREWRNGATHAWAGIPGYSPYRTAGLYKTAEASVRCVAISSEQGRGADTKIPSRNPDGGAFWGVWGT